MYPPNGPPRLSRVWAAAQHWVCKCVTEDCLSYLVGTTPSALEAVALLPPPSSAPKTLPLTPEGVEKPPALSLPGGSSTILAAEPSQFRLASAFAPIPSKLVKRIQKLEFIELRELLPDNIALAEKLESLPTHSHMVKSPEQREISSIVSWVSCFATYLAVVLQVHPERSRDMLAYMRLVVREAYKFDGQGWLMYDSIFRKNNQGPTARWDMIDPSLHMAYIQGLSNRPRVPCPLCQECDHRTENCAKASLETSTRGGPRTEDRGYGHLARRGKRPLLYNMPLPYPRAPRTESSSVDPNGLGKICISWNRGQCAVPGACTYQHICATCNSKEHRAKDCERTHQDSMFKKMSRY